MTYDLQFVDQITASPTVRLNLRAAPWILRDGTEFPPPELRRSVVSTLLRDGDGYPSGAYGNRTLEIVLQADATATDDEVATALQTLYRELDRPTNILRYRPGTTEPVFFRTFRAGPSDVVWNPVLKEVTVSIPAEPFAVGLRETLSTVTVYNDPAEGTTLNAYANFDVEPTILNANPYFETSAANWTGTGGTVARSTVQFHEGVASLLLPPDGVTATVEARSENASGIVVGQSYAALAWVRCALARSVNINIVWRDAGGVFLSSAGAVSFSLAAGTWTPIEVIGVAPASAAQAQISVSMGSTPPVSHTLHIDEAKLQSAAVSPWTALGGTVARSTMQSVTGAASLLLTPSGVDVVAETRSELVPVTVGQQYRASAWVWCAAARSVNVGVAWRDASDGSVSQSLTAVSVAASTWTLISGTHTAPAGAVYARMVGAALGSTPPATHLTYVDDARLRQAGGVGGMCFDVTGIKGDVETPLYLSLAATDLTPTLATWSIGYGRRQSVVAVRRGGTPSRAPLVLQAESMTINTDTTAQPNGTAMSGSGQNFMRTTFATVSALEVRLLHSPFPATASTDVRGTYRVFARVRQTVGTDVMQMRMSYALDSSAVFGDIATLPGGTVLRWVDLGTVQFPLGYDPEFDGLSGTPMSVRGVQVAVYAARVSGSGSLDMDAFMFVPADDRYCAVRWPEYGSPTSYVLDSGANQVYAVGSSGEVRSTATELAGLPPMVSPGVTNRLVFLRDVGDETEAGDSVTAVVSITPYYWPRYLTVRPVTT